MFFLNYIISSIYRLSNRIAKRQTSYPEFVTKVRFSVALSVYSYVLFFLGYKFLTKFIKLKTIWSFDTIITISVSYVILLSLLLYFTFNFEWVKKIELNKKQKRDSRIILLILLVVILFFLIKN
jgi:hypothetical protein